MQQQTHDNLPEDVKEATVGEVEIDESVPEGMVELRAKPTPHQKTRPLNRRLSSPVFCKEIRKRERQNKRRGRLATR